MSRQMGLCVPYGTKLKKPQPAQPVKPAQN